MVGHKIFFTEKYGLIIPFTPLIWNTGSIVSYMCLPSGHITMLIQCHRVETTLIQHCVPAGYTLLHLGCLSKHITCTQPSVGFLSSHIMKVASFGETCGGNVNVHSA